MTGTNLDFVLLRGVYLVISCLVAQKMFSPSIFLSSGLSAGPMNYGFSQTSHTALVQVLSNGSPT